MDHQNGDDEIDLPCDDSIYDKSIAEDIDQLMLSRKSENLAVAPQSARNNRSAQHASEEMADILGAKNPSIKSMNVKKQGLNGK